MKSKIILISLLSIVSTIQMNSFWKAHTFETRKNPPCPTNPNTVSGWAKYKDNDTTIEFEYRGEIDPDNCNTVYNKTIKPDIKSTASCYFFIHTLYAHKDETGKCIEKFSTHRII